MKKQRKTEDEFQIHGLFEGGWEELTADDNRQSARITLKEYKENDPSHVYKLVKKRIKKVLTVA